MDVFPLLILSLAIIVYFPAFFNGNNQPQPAGKRIPGYCCTITTVNFPPQTQGADLFCVSPGAISLHTARAGQSQQCPQHWRALVLAAELHVQCKCHIIKGQCEVSLHVGWGTRGSSAQGHGKTTWLKPLNQILT